MRRAKLRRFDLKAEGTDMPLDEAFTLCFVATFGVIEPAFQRLAASARCAWSWRAFGEPA